MIVAEQKSLDEIRALVHDAKNVLVVGCGTCVTVCFAGGSHEASILATSLRMASKLNGNTQQVTDVTVQRQCEWEYLDQIAEQVQDVDIVLSLGCGIGVQAIAEHFPDTWVVPGLNTSFNTNLSAGCKVLFTDFCKLSNSDDAVPLGFIIITDFFIGG